MRLGHLEHALYRVLDGEEFSLKHFLALSHLTRNTAGHTIQGLRANNEMKHLKGIS